jgi:hypothetical protein
MPAISEAVRGEVRARAGGRCEYCLHQEAYSSDSFAIDHIHPRSRGGSDELDNLALACGGCNGRKYNKTESIDTATGRTTPLFHPRQDDWPKHFQWSGDFSRMIGITARGRATIGELELNRQGLTRIRAILASAGRHPPSRVPDQE